jgi:hypothetical protein
MLIWRESIFQLIHKNSCLVQICSYVAFTHCFFSGEEENMAGFPGMALAPLGKRGRQKPGGG